MNRKIIEIALRQNCRFIRTRDGRTDVCLEWLAFAPPDRIVGRLGGKEIALRVPAVRAQIDGMEADATAQLGARVRLVVLAGGVFVRFGGRQRPMWMDDVSVTDIVAEARKMGSGRVKHFEIE